MKNLLHHLFVPRESNNYRAKLLHETHILLAIVFLLLGTFFLSSARARYPSVLGISYDVTGQQLLSLTNQKRQASGLSPLTINPQLSQAAAAKASDMFSKNYWAHNAPDGTTPW
ncbi:MAG TPA: CAP domain-containing protein, partial [Candidatus Saccharimonadales bacterium]|nr:CAP domain-containing protein [Candidatus Saccharimonadales bacterium]